MQKPRAEAPDIEQLVTFRLSFIYHRLALANEPDVTRQFGLALREWRVLAFLAKHQPLQASHLVARSPMDKAGVSRAVASLLKSKLIESTVAPDDRRVKILRLTAAGEHLHEEAVPHSLALQDKILSAFTPSEQKTFLRLLDKLQRHVEKIDQ
ncbi:MAG: transcriptional regulator, MarR family protein [Caulobacteraceae bacterium]|nr:transcriptional regulator, MarR family protein [Caulobacteraceae bacterium]